VVSLNFSSQHTLVVAAYVVVPTDASQSGDRAEGSGLMVEASDPSENVVFAKTTELVGRFAFTTAGARFVSSRACSSRS
jgi:hypothetical protein